MMVLSKENKITVSIVANRTSVASCILLENEDFYRLLVKGTSIEELVNFALENF